MLAEIVPELYYDLGELHEETGNFVEAGKAFQGAISSYKHPLDHKDTPEYIIKSHFQLFYISYYKPLFLSVW